MNPREFSILEQGSYRASESNRDDTIMYLREALATGRLDQDVFDRRLEAAMRCYNQEDLRMLTRDIILPPQPLASKPKRHTTGSTAVTAFQAFLAGVLIMVMGFSFLFTAHAPAGVVLNSTGTKMFVPAILALVGDVGVAIWRGLDATTRR